VLPQINVSAPAMANLAPKAEDRFGADDDAQLAKATDKSTKTAEAVVPTGSAAAPQK
jgi:hypothetical protein